MLQYANEEVCDPLDGADDGWLHYNSAGHGTHVSGLVAANGLDQSGVRGACVSCGLVSVRRSSLFCRTIPAPARVLISTDPDTDGIAIEHLYKTGVQVVNMSFSNSLTNCQAASNNRLCNAFATAYKNDILLVAAAGNNKTFLQFPARDPRVASVGGLNDANGFWDESFGGTVSCPFPGSAECGSNFAQDTVSQVRQEVVAPATSVRSTFYPGVNWSTDIGCGDAYGDGSASDGEGACTGTSMSAPELAGLYGLVRSVNPLLRAGDPVNQASPPTPDGVREVVAQTASRSVALQGEDPKWGFGIPSADLAVKRVLGTVRNMAVRNRVTPLFTMYSPGSADYANVATPQLASALLVYGSNAHRSVPIAGDTFIPGAAIPGYSAFPNPDAGAPRARAMILTTEGRPAPFTAAMPSPVPLVLMEKKRLGPVSCTLSSATCHGDSVLTLESQVQAAVNQGYSYAGRQGYVYAQCAPEATCMPPGTQQLHVKCKTSIQDCAVFLESERLAFEAAGYTSTFVGATSSVLGYAYGVGDADGDGLVDAMEYVIGTATNDADSDNDGANDAVEYPLTSVPLSDPCSGSGPSNTCTLGQGYVFANGFE